MKINNVKFEIEIQGKNIPATCSIYRLEGQELMPYKYPIYRVAINNHRIKPDVFLFYEVNGKEKKFFSYPFAEGKEIIGGYFIINADGYDEAVALCADYPDFENGGKVIIRQLQKMDMPPA